jgi:hypothetical protein
LKKKFCSCLQMANPQELQDEFLIKNWQRHISLVPLGYGMYLACKEGVFSLLKYCPTTKQKKTVEEVENRLKQLTSMDLRFVPLKEIQVHLKTEAAKMTEPLENVDSMEEFLKILELPVHDFSKLQTLKTFEDCDLVISSFFLFINLLLGDEWFNSLLEKTNWNCQNSERKARDCQLLEITKIGDILNNCLLLRSDSRHRIHCFCVV